MVSLERVLVTTPESAPRPAEPPTGVGVMRSARLRHAHAALYPGLDAGVWYPAQSVADYFRAWLQRHPPKSGGAAARVLESSHFEFRGGVPREPPWHTGATPDERT